MTTGEYLDSISTVTGVSALTHLQNISTGGGSGIEYRESFTAIATNTNFSYNLETETYTADIDSAVYTANLDTKEP